MENKISGFFEEKRFLSNMYPSKFTYEGITYKTNEHFYVAMKFKKNVTIIVDTIDGTEEKNIREYVSNLTDGKKRKKFGQEQKKLIRKDWHKVKLKVMEYGIREKFKIESLRKKLLETGDRILIEENTWNDTFWGMCNGIGKNNLGKILMKIREEIKLEIKNKLIVENELNLQ